MYDLKELSGEEIHLLDRIVEGWETYGQDCGTGWPSMAT